MDKTKVGLAPFLESLQESLELMERIVRVPLRHSVQIQEMGPGMPNVRQQDAEIVGQYQMKIDD